MASSRKRRSVESGVKAAAGAFLSSIDLRGKRLLVGLSGGADSVVLLHVVNALGFPAAALHVHHGLSPNADAWARFCRRYCRALGVPLRVVKVRVSRTRGGLEAGARAARYAAFEKARADAVLLAHQLDDQAETVLLNLLRGAGVRGASGMPARGRLGAKLLLRPLLAVPREAVLAYAHAHQLGWIDDESNADETLTRNFIRRSLAPLLASRFPRWREALARAARHFGRREAGAEELLRAWLRTQGLRAPSEAKLGEMLRQLAGHGPRTMVRHDGASIRAYRGGVLVDDSPMAAAFAPVPWCGEGRVRIPELGGEVRFRRARAQGLSAEAIGDFRLELRPRSGGERLQLHPRRPRRTLKNLFQEAGVPPWERERVPLLFCDGTLVWVPGVGIDARFQAAAGEAGWVPEWCPDAPNSLFLAKKRGVRGRLSG